MIFRRGDNLRAQYYWRVRPAITVKVRLVAPRHHGARVRRDRDVAVPVERGKIGAHRVLSSQHLCSHEKPTQNQVAEATYLPS